MVRIEDSAQHQNEQECRLQTMKTEIKEIKNLKTCSSSLTMDLISQISVGLSDKRKWSKREAKIILHKIWGDPN